jgi:sugar lactone lactonase YvrE
VATSSSLVVVVTSPNQAGATGPTPIRLNTSSPNPQAIAVDSNGDVFLSDATTQVITVLPKTTGTLFGQSVIAGQAVPLSATSSLSAPNQLAFDTAGDLFIADGNGIDVLAKTSTTIFGQSFAANTPTTLITLASFGGSTINGLAFDSSGDLYVSDAASGHNAIYIYPSSGTTPFGSFTADSLSTLPNTSSGSPQSMAFDANNNLYVEGARIYVYATASGTYFGTTVSSGNVKHLLAISAISAADLGALSFDSTGDLFDNAGSLFVLPANSGTIFGQVVTQNVLSSLSAPSETDNEPIAFDSSDNLFIADSLGGALVLPTSTTSLYGQSVSASTAVTLWTTAAISSATSSAIDSSGNLYLINGQRAAVVVRPAMSGSLFGQSVTAGVMTILNATTGIGLAPQSLAVDDAGDLFIGDAGGSVYVLAKSTTAIFGVNVTQSVVTQLFTPDRPPVGLAFDPAGDLFVSEDNSCSTGDEIVALTATAKTLFGVTVAARTPTVIKNTADCADGLAFDGAGDLFIGSQNGVLRVLAAGTTTPFGQSVTPNALANVTNSPVGMQTPSLGFDESGNLYFVDASAAQIYVMSPTGTALGESVSTNTPVVITPSGFASSQSVLPDSHGDLYVTESTELWLLSPGLSIDQTSLPDVTDSTPYNQALTDSGGVLPVSWTVSSGSPPAGLSLGASGVLSGTPTGAGSTFTVTVTDFEGTTSSKQFSILATQTVSVTSSAPSGKSYSGANNQTYNITAQAGSGLSPSLSIDASSASICTISGSTVSYGGAVGSCTIDANQPGGSGWAPAPQSQQSFTIAKAAQTVLFTSSAPTSRTYSGSNNQSYTVSATGGGSGNAVSFSIDAASAAVCTVTGAIVSYGGAVGTCTIDADQSGDTHYLSAAEAQQSFAIAKADQTVSFTSTAPSAAQAGSGSYSPTASATSGLAVTVAVDASATTICSITGGVVAFLNAGTCVLNADQAGDSHYNAAPRAQQSFAVAAVSSNPSPSPSPPPVSTSSTTSTTLAEAPAVVTTTTTTQANTTPTSMPRSTHTSTQVTPTLKVTATTSEATGHLLTYSVSLHGKKGQAPPSGSVTVTASRNKSHQGSPVVLGKSTLKAGRGTVTATATLPVGTYTVSITYGGDKKNKRVTVTKTLVVTRHR